MYIVKLNITGLKARTDEFFEFVGYYLDFLYESTQIINEEWQYETIENGVSLNLFCLEKDSYSAKNSTIYANSWKKRVEDEFECKFEFKDHGFDPELKGTPIPDKSKFYVLKFEGFSPLLDGESSEQIPLYKIPYTYSDGACYNDINFWGNNYQRIEGLWFNGYVGEKWAQNQMQNHDSELSKQGMECCRKIEQVTGIPTYYHLFNYRAWGEKKDRGRKCPSYGGDWSSHGDNVTDLYFFKCDKCRLVSHLSLNK